jgi:glutamate synthase domain-containing protein 1
MTKRILKRKCNKQTSKKYINRPSPPYSAADCKNLKMVGNDNNIYISSSSTKTHVYKWQLYKKKQNKTKKIL